MKTFIWDVLRFVRAVKAMGGSEDEKAQLTI